MFLYVHSIYMWPIQGDRQKRAAKRLEVFVGETVERYTLSAVFAKSASVWRCRMFLLLKPISVMSLCLIDCPTVYVSLSVVVFIPGLYLCVST